MSLAQAGPARRNTFPRSVSLKQRRLLGPLFRRGQAQTLASGSIRLLYGCVAAEHVPGGVPVQVALIPGRCATAVARNRIRRALREVYRVHQHGLVDLFLCRPDALTLAILYRGRGARPFESVSRDLPPLLDRLAATLRAEDSRNPSRA